MNNNMKCDAYIFLPCYVLNIDKKIMSIDNVPFINQEFIRILESVSDYECIGDISSQFKRYWLGDYEFACCDDEYENEFCKTLPNNRIHCIAKSSVYLTYHENTRLGVMIISIPSLVVDISLVADQISSEYIYIRRETKNEFFYLYSFIEKEFNIIHLDVPRVIFTLGEKPNPVKKMESILAGNAYQSKHVEYQANSEKIRADAVRNIAEYDFYEAYVSSNVLLYILKDFSDNFHDNIEYEASLIFICELIIFQNGAIDRVNKKVINELTLPRRLKLKSIEDMEVEFGKSIIFWNKNVFKYPLVQNLSNNILKAFGTYELLDAYTRNQKYLEHIVELRVSQTTEKEGKIINFIAILLACVQIMPILIEWSKILPESKLYNFFLITSHISVFIFLIFIVQKNQNLILKKLKKKK